MTVEATASYEWFVRLVEPLAQRVILAHPGKLRIIAESTRKTDRLDARTLADLLARDQIPPAYRPTPRQRDHRRLVRQRAFWQRKLTAVRNKLRHLLADYNADRPDLFTADDLEALPTVAALRAEKIEIERTDVADFRIGLFGRSGDDLCRRLPVQEKAGVRFSHLLGIDVLRTQTFPRLIDEGHELMTVFGVPASAGPEEEAFGPVRSCVDQVVLP